MYKEEEDENRKEEENMRREKERTGERKEGGRREGDKGWYLQASIAVHQVV